MRRCRRSRRRAFESAHHHFLEVNESDDKPVLPRPLPPSTTRFAGAPPVVLVVADSAAVRKPLVSTLVANGFRTFDAGPATKTLSHAVTHAHELVLLDLEPPGGTGGGAAGVEHVRVATRVRAMTSAPILVILPHPDEPAQVAVLDCGANDFIVRPFETSELLARMRVWLKQVARLKSTRMPVEAPCGRVRFDGERRALFVDGRAVHVTPIEHRLVLALVRNPGEAMTERQAMAAVWGDGAPTQARYLRMIVRQLRLKIERDPLRPEHLMGTAEGGYRLNLG
jgi:two-component system KDP operon response regulator KdpE